MKGRYWTAAQRQALERELNQTEDLSLYRRLLALLEVDQGRSIAEVARELHVDERSIYRWINRYQAAGGQVRALGRRLVLGRPAKWSKDLQDLLESALAQPPVEIGYPANTWTLPLLQAFLAVFFPGQEVSICTLRRRLREMGYVWKRFRHVLPPDPQEEKKTRNSGPNPRFTKGSGSPGRRRNRPSALSTPTLGMGAPGPEGSGPDLRGQRPAIDLRHPASAHRPHAPFGATPKEGGRLSGIPG